MSFSKGSPIIASSISNKRTTEYKTWNKLERANGAKRKARTTDGRASVGFTQIILIDVRLPRGKSGHEMRFPLSAPLTDRDTLPLNRIPHISCKSENCPIRPRVSCIFIVHLYFTTDWNMNRFRRDTK